MKNSFNINNFVLCSPIILAIISCSFTIPIYSSSVNFVPEPNATSSPANFPPSNANSAFKSVKTFVNSIIDEEVGANGTNSTAIEDGISDMIFPMEYHRRLIRSGSRERRREIRPSRSRNRDEDKNIEAQRERGRSRERLVEHVFFHIYADEDVRKSACL